MCVDIVPFETGQRHVMFIGIFFGNVDFCLHHDSDWELFGPR